MPKVSGIRRWPSSGRPISEVSRRGSRVLDLASGAGSIYAHLPEGHTFQLSATDISDVALEALQGRFPGVSTVVCSADDIPLDDASFDAVVTQFGAEYAGMSAFAEAARLVAPGGKFIGLCHIQDGYIDSSNRQQLAEAQIVAEQEFIDHATRMITGAFSGDSAALKSAQDAFVTAATPVGEGMRRCSRESTPICFRASANSMSGGNSTTSQTSPDGSRPCAASWTSTSIG